MVVLCSHGPDFARMGQAQQGEFEKVSPRFRKVWKEQATGLCYLTRTAWIAGGCMHKKQCYGQALEFWAGQSRLDDENTERFYAAEIYRLLGETSAIEP
jgi:hypothetical protein